MYHVIGNCPKKIELKDLNDSIYYKQQKIYSDAQYNASNDLKDAERKGLVTILQRSPEKGGSAELSSVVLAQQSTNPSLSTSSTVDNKQIENLTDKIREIESSIKSLASQKQSDSTGFLEQLSDKISKMEQNIQGAGMAPVMTVFFDALKKLEDKISTTQQSDELLKKLTSIINQSSIAPVAREKEEVRPEDVYVPSVTVEDANTHVKLQVRTLENSSGVGDALKALKNLKSKT